MSDLTAQADLLRIAVPVGPSGSPTWCIRGSDGAPAGIGVDLGFDVARRAGLRPRVIEYASSGAIVDAVGSGAWDVAFIPADAERKRHVRFGANYFLGESTYLVARDSSIVTLADVDHPDRTIAGVEGTATLRSARRTAPSARAVGALGLAEAIELFEGGEADALALSRESLDELVGKLTRSGRVLAESFHTAGHALAMPPDRESLLVLLSQQLELAKADGTVAAIFARHGMAHLPVAPLGSVP